VEKENILFYKYRYRFCTKWKKTVIIGCDLKTKLFDEFNLSNEVGIVNYLIKQKSLDEIINHTQILSRCHSFRPGSSNPSELIMSDGMSELIELKKTYDYIILDATSGTGF
jgi:Mrp family chromosome partitioning ATPase